MAQRTMFSFYDYDCNGDIGSVDIINLKKYFDHFYLENILREFTDRRIKMELQKSLHKQIFITKQANSNMIMNRHQYYDQGESELMLQTMKNKERKLRRTFSILEKKIDSDSDMEDYISSEEEIVDPVDKLTPQQRVLNDLWTQFLMELHSLRNHYVHQKVMPKQHSIQGSFRNFDFKQYELKFLVQMENNYDIKTPSFVYFMKEKLLYDFSFSSNNKKIRGEMHTGYWEKHKKRPHEVSINPELLQMEKLLDALLV